jgi:dTDP-4-dehydrorhamnose 3,5-epimerase
MQFTPTTLKDAYLVELSPMIDERGWFARTYCKNEFAAIDHKKEWVQINQSFTATKGTIRGMHFQQPPQAEIKLVRCIAGAVFDVIVDLRSGSLTFLQWFGVELSAGNKKMLYIPKGFAHGFQTLSNDAEMIYCHSAFYTAGFEGAIRYNDPAVNVHWPLPVTAISEKDKNHPLLNDYFTGIKL